MKKFGEYFEKSLSIIASIASILASLYGAIISLEKSSMSIAILFIVIILLDVVFLIFNIFTSIEYFKKIEYINFVEYLFNNDTHRFTLLPKLRMYIENRHLKNKVHIENLRIIYNINRNDLYKNENIGNLQITYLATIENYNMPKQYYVLAGNDYAQKKPTIKYAISHKPIKKDDNLMFLNFDVPKHSEYERGMINEATIHLPTTIPYLNIFLKLVHEYECSFNFSQTPTDTLILLPMLYGIKIDTIDYEIHLNGFEDYDELFCSAFMISNNKKMKPDYRIEDISYMVRGDSLDKKIKLYPKNSELAYYFRIGISKELMTP